MGILSREDRVDEGLIDAGRRMCRGVRRGDPFDHGHLVRLRRTPTGTAGRMDVGMIDRASWVRQ
jgi:hypothetical protein